MTAKDVLTEYQHIRNARYALDEMEARVERMRLEHVPTSVRAERYRQAADAAEGLHQCEVRMRALLDGCE